MREESFLKEFFSLPILGKIFIIAILYLILNFTYLSIQANLKKNNNKTEIVDTYINSKMQYVYKTRDGREIEYLDKSPGYKKVATLLKKLKSSKCYIMLTQKGELNFWNSEPMCYSKEIIKSK